MREINNSNGISLTDLGLNSAAPVKKNDELAQEDFLKLLMAQVNNSDSLNPQNASDFVDQLASIGRVNGIGDLQSAFTELSSQLQSSQALQASSLVARSVYVPSDHASLPAEGNINGSVELPVNTPQLGLTILNGQGEIVQ